MDKKIAALIKKADDARGKYDSAVGALSAAIRPLCDFEAVITYCAGDGHLVLDEDSADVAVLRCLKGKSEKNKLSKKEHKTFCI